MSKAWAAITLTLISGISPGQSRKSRAEAVLVENTDPICRAAERFCIRPRLVASVIFVEHYMNVSWVDRELDVTFARLGYNSSIGLGQVKVKTAEWIEESLHDPTSAYYLGDTLESVIPRSSSREEMIRRLADASWNALYVAANIAMIAKRWEGAGFSIATNVAILATLYSTGVVAEGKEMKIPHANPRPNTFGKIATRFYDSGILGSELLIGLK